MAGNFLKYAGPLNWNDLPVDSHELVALCAPRPVFISAGATQGDGWVDAKGSSWPPRAPVRCTGFWARRTWAPPSFRRSRPALIDGDVAFRQHSGGPHSGPELAGVYRPSRSGISRRSKLDGAAEIHPFHRPPPFPMNNGNSGEGYVTSTPSTLAKDVRVCRSALAALMMLSWGFRVRSAHRQSATGGSAKAHPLHT